MRLRYIGTSPDPISFQTLGIDVESGGEFDVPDEDADGYTRRTDVEAVEEPAETKPAKKSPAGKPAAAPAADPEPADAKPEPAPTKEA